MLKATQYATLRLHSLLIHVLRIVWSTWFFYKNSSLSSARRVSTLFRKTVFPEQFLTHVQIFGEAAERINDDLTLQSTCSSSSTWQNSMPSHYFWDLSRLGILSVWCSHKQTSGSQWNNSVTQWNLAQSYGSLEKGKRYILSLWKWPERLLKMYIWICM